MYFPFGFPMLLLLEEETEIKARLSYIRPQRPGFTQAGRTYSTACLATEDEVKITAKFQVPVSIPAGDGPGSKCQFCTGRLVCCFSFQVLVGNIKTGFVYCSVLV